MRSSPLASALGMEHHHPILGMIGGNIGQFKRRDDNTLSECFQDFLYAGRTFQWAHDAMEMIYPPSISAFVDDNSYKIYTNFSSILFNIQVNAPRHDGHIWPFINVMLDSILRHNKHLKYVAGEASMITVEFIQAAYVFGISSYTLNEWWRKVK